MLFFTVVVSALIWATQATPTGNHTCTGVVKHPVTVRVNVTEPVTFRTYTWCLRVPPRCSKYTIQLKDRIKIHTEMHNRTITICCKGYVEMDYKCVPACPPQTDCPFMHCNRTNHCYCTPGYTGLYCNEPCDRGFWGTDCMKTCDCPSGYTCHHLTGDCLLDDRPPSKTRRTTTTTAITSGKPTSTFPTLTTAFIVETTDPMTSTTLRATTPAQTTPTKETESATFATTTTEATTTPSTTAKITSTTETPTTMQETEGTTTRSTTEITISRVPTVFSTVAIAAYTESTRIPTSFVPLSTTTATPSTTTTTPPTTTNTPTTTTTTPSTTTTESTTTTTPSTTITESTTIVHSTVRDPPKEYPYVTTEHTTTTTESPTTNEMSTRPTTLIPKTTLSPESTTTELVPTITTVSSTTTTTDSPAVTVYTPTVTTSPSFTNSPPTPTTYVPTTNTEFQITTNTPAKTTTESMVENTESYEVTTKILPSTTKTYSTIASYTVPSIQTTATTADPSVTQSTTTTSTTVVETSTPEKIKPATVDSAIHFEFTLSSTSSTIKPSTLLPIESNEDHEVAPTFKSDVLETTAPPPKQEIAFIPVEPEDKIETTQPNVITTISPTSPNVNNHFVTTTEINTIKPNVFTERRERTTERTQTEFSTKESNFGRVTERTAIPTTVRETYNPIESYLPEQSVIESPIETFGLVTSTSKPNTTPADVFLNFPFHSFNVSDKQLISPLSTTHTPKEIKIYNSDTLFRQFSTKSPINKQVDDRNNDNLAISQYLNIRTLPTQSVISQTPTPFPLKETETSSMATVTAKPTTSTAIQTESIPSQTTPDLEISKRNYQESKIHYIKLASNEAQSPTTALPFDNERIKTALPAFELEKESIFDATTAQMTKSPKQHKEKYHKKHKSIKHFEQATTDSPHITAENKFETTVTNKPFEPTDYKLLPGINKPYKFYPKSHTKSPTETTLGNETWIRNIKNEESVNTNHPTTLKPFDTIEKDEVKISQITTETNPSWTTGKPSHTWYSHVREKAKIKEAMKTLKTTSVSDNSNYHIKPTEVYDRDSNDINSMQTSYTEMVKNMRESQDDKIIDQLLEKNRHNLSRIVVAGIHAEKAENDFYSAATLIIGFCVMMLMTLLTLLWLRLKKKNRETPETPHGSSILAFTPQTETMSPMIYETVYPISDGPELLEATTFFCPTFTNHYAERINRELSELNYDRPRRTSVYESTFAEVGY